MNISSISMNENCKPRRNMFISYSNSFMSMMNGNGEAVEKAQMANPIETPQKPVKMGIENLQEFTIFPKETVDGKTVITA